MSDQTKLAWQAALRYEYEICQIRGHIEEGVMLTIKTLQPLGWSTCKYCGTIYRYETCLVERNVPES